MLVLVAAAAGHSGAQTVPDMAVIMHAGTPAEALDRAALVAIFTVTRRSWQDGTAIVPVNAPPEAPLRHTFDRAVLGLEPAQASRFWIDQRIRSGTRPPRHVADARLLVRLVAQLPGSIGYVPEALISGEPRVRVVGRIRGGKLVPP